MIPNVPYSQSEACCTCMYVFVVDIIVFSDILQVTLNVSWCDTIQCDMHIIKRYKSLFYNTCGQVTPNFIKYDVHRKYLKYCVSLYILI